MIRNLKIYEGDMIERVSLPSQVSSPSPFPVYLPFWMMRNLMMNEGDMIGIESVSLPVATFSKFQPSSPEFLDISNPKAVLENTLRNFACLTTGDVIAIKYNDKTFELTVLETKVR